MNEETFGARLRRLREQAGFSQAGLARKSSIPQGNISRYEADERCPDLTTLYALARGLGASLGDFDGVIGGGD